jgi:two-component system chemotaxis response regulator CheB
MSRRTIRVLVVDDSPTSRTQLVTLLRADPDLQVVGEACDGVEALELTRRLSPDLVTMDVHMPRKDGLAATEDIMREMPRPIVVITGATPEEETLSMNALRAGAVCVLRKPPGPQAPGYFRETRQLIDTVRAMADVKVVRRTRPVAPSPGTAPSRNGVRIAVLAIAASTGGPAALRTLIGQLPADFAPPILVVQHISHGFIPGLARWLDGAGPFRVRVAAAGEALTSGTVYVAPDDRHLGVSGATIVLSQAPAIGGFRPSATFLFESVATAFGAGAVALVLTGMGEDGVAGLRAVREKHGRVLVQDEQSCVVFGMPKSAIEAGVADEVVPLAKLAGRLQEMVRGGREP